MHEYKERPGACKACGNSPVNHTFLFCMSTLGIWQGSFEKAVGSSFIARLEALMRRFMSRIDTSVYRIFTALGAITFGHDPERAASYRSQVIWEEAQRRGIEMEQLRFLGTDTDVYRARINGRWKYFESLPIPTHLTQTAYGWLDDKVMLNEFLRESGIPIPPAYSVTSEAAALRAFEKSGGRVAIKPRAGSRGRHTTTGIHTTDQVREGFRLAQKLCRYVYASEHLDGSVCRGTLVEGKLVGFFQADPPRLTGDGHSSINELIVRANASKPERVENIVLTDEHNAFIARQGYTPDSILETRKRIALTHRTGRLFGGETRELLESVHPHLRDYLERAAKGLDVPIVGFDLIIENPEADPDGQKWGIIEANSLPFIDLHYLPLHGKPSNVAAHVWDLWKKESPAEAGTYHVEGGIGMKARFHSVRAKT